jgi:hypothetical protein
MRAKATGSIPTDPEALLTVPMAERLSALGKSFLYAAMQRKDLPYYQFGDRARRARRIRRSDLFAFLDRHRVPAAVGSALPASA